MMAETSETVAKYNDFVSKYYEHEGHGNDMYSNANLRTGTQWSTGAAFGGLVFSQAICAAQKTVGAEFAPNSAQCLFVCGVTFASALEHRVRRLRDGASFCSRIVEGYQDGTLRIVVQISFHKKENDSCVHQAVFPQVAQPEDLPSTKQVAADVLKQFHEGKISLNSSNIRRCNLASASDEDDVFDTICTEPMLHLGLAEPQNGRTIYYWLRTHQPLISENEHLGRFLIAYASDLCVPGTSFRAHVINGFELSQFFSLSHSVWFHERNFKVDEWMLYECTTNKAGSGRVTIEGRMWSRDGRLLLTTVQECVVRTKGPVSRL